MVLRTISSGNRSRKLQRGKISGPVLAIVGSEAAKFTPAWERTARRRIRETFLRFSPIRVVSGDCHLGGIDKWAIEEARKNGISVREFPPLKRSWKYYRARNIQIAEAADIVLCITVRSYRNGYKGMRFPLCYHCKTTNHVKSGGCWTMWYAKRIGKEIALIVIGD